MAYETESNEKAPARRYNASECRSKRSLPTDSETLAARSSTVRADACLRRAQDGRSFAARAPSHVEAGSESKHEHTSLFVQLQSFDHRNAADFGIYRIVSIVCESLERLTVSTTYFTTQAEKKSQLHSNFSCSCALPTPLFHLRCR